MQPRTLIAALAAATLTAFPAAAQERPIIEVGVTKPDGSSAGTVTFEQVAHGLVLTTRLENLPEGGHGFHIHQTGACEPDFQAAGGHYNPTDAEHGYDTPQGYHAGDLPNVYAMADGTATADFFVPHLTLESAAGDGGPYTLFDDDGSTIMVHAQIDDYQAQPPDSTGERIACGVIAPRT